jgi:hypothetical protein
MYIGGRQPKTVQTLNKAVQDLLKQPVPEKANARSHTRQAAPKISRPTAKPGNLAHAGRLSSTRSDVQEEPSPEQPAAVDSEDEEPRPKRAKRFETTTKTNTSPLSTKSPISKSRRIQRSRKSKQPSNEPAESQPIEESQTRHMDPNIEDQADGLVMDETPKRKRGRPRKYKPRSISANDEADAGEAVGAQEAGEPEDQAEDANIDDSRHPLASPPDMGVDLADTEIFYKMKAHLEREIPPLKDRYEEVRDLNGATQTKSKSEEIIENLMPELESLNESYCTLRASKIRGRVKDTKEAETNVTNSLRNIIFPSAESLRLKKESTLAAVYLYLIPSFVGVITIGVDAYTVTEPVSTASIRKIEFLLGLVINLATKAVKCDDGIQPKTMDMQPLRSPILEILPMIKEAQNKFLAELASRYSSRYRAEQEQINAMQEGKIRQEKERRKELERISTEQRQMQEMETRVKYLAELRQRKEAEGKRARLNDLHKRQWRALNAMKKEDPHLATWITMGVAQDDARSTAVRDESNHGSQTSEPARSAHPLATLDYDELVRNERYASEDPTRAKPPAKRVEHPFARESNETKIAFVDIMRSELGIITP